MWSIPRWVENIQRWEEWQFQRVGFMIIMENNKNKNFVKMSEGKFIKNKNKLN